MDIAIFFTASFLCISIWGLLRARRAVTEDRRVQALVIDAATTTIADAPSKGLIQITGRVGIEGGGDPVTAPFTGDEVAWARAQIDNGSGGVLAGWTVSVDHITIDDDSGRLAKVALRGATMRFSQQSVSDDQGARYVVAYLDKQGYQRPTHNSGFTTQAVIRPGDTVSVIATAHEAEAGYREGASAAISLSVDDGEVLVFNPDEEAKRPGNDQFYLGCATFGIIAFGVTTLILVLLRTL